jgi:hypothetical protein
MPPARNDITGDVIASRTNNKKFDENFDLIFKENYGTIMLKCGLEYPKCSKRCWVEEVDGKLQCNKPTCEEKL